MNRLDYYRLNYLNYYLGYLGLVVHYLKVLVLMEL